MTTVLATPLVSRRSVLRAAGVTLVRPVLESVAPLARATTTWPIRRMVCCCTALDIYRRS